MATSLRLARARDIGCATRRRAGLGELRHLGGTARMPEASPRGASEGMPAVDPCPRRWPPSSSAASPSRASGRTSRRARGRVWSRPATKARALLDGRTVWSINSTALGGGVAEMQRTLWPYWRAAGIDARWLVMNASRDFFRFTKRLHNLLHGRPRAPARVSATRRSSTGLGGGRRRGRRARRSRRRRRAAGPADRGPGRAAAARRREVVWRCHVGADTVTPPVEAAWRFLLPYVEDADAFVVHASRVRPRGTPGRARDAALAGDRPAVGEEPAARVGRRARSPRPLGARARRLRQTASSSRSGAGTGSRTRWGSCTRSPGTSRIRGRSSSSRAPRSASSPTTPRALRVLAEVRAAWRGLAPRRRERVQVAALPMTDLNENALIVNALQREAAVIVKKSLQEGFGLGVTEGMWKAKPVVATRVGGHRDQIEHRRSGLLVDDPADLPGFATAVDEAPRRPRARRGAGCCRPRAGPRPLPGRPALRQLDGCAAASAGAVTGTCSASSAWKPSGGTGGACSSGSRTCSASLAWNARMPGSRGKVMVSRLRPRRPRRIR